MPTFLQPTLVALVTFAFCSLAIAENHFTNWQQATFLNAQFDLDPDKINRFRSRVVQKRLELVGLDEDNEITARNSVILTEERQVKGTSAKKLPKKLRKSDYNRSLLRSIELIDLALSDNSSVRERLALLTEAWHLEQATNVENYLPGLKLVRAAVSSVIHTWKIPKSSPTEKQAIDLEPAKNQDEKEDSSLRNPLPNNGFWENPGRISKLSMKRVSQGKTSSLYNKADLFFPKDRTYYYREVKHSNTRPKIKVYGYDKKGEKYKFKIKVGSETHSEPTATTLMRALGFHADLNRHEKDIKLILGKTTLADLMLAWESYYRRDELTAWPYYIERYIKEVGANEKEGNYVIFKEAVIEAAPDSIERIGPWYYKGPNEMSRAMRGLLLVQMWLGNPDVKPDNNKLVLKKRKNRPPQTYFLISDPGNTFGNFVGEKPDDFKWDLVRKSSDNRMTLTYKNFLPMPTDILTIEDAKWAVRLIGQLTRRQIESAIKIGQWPQCIAEIYVEKLIERRNGLVSALDLEKELGQLRRKSSREDLKISNNCDPKELLASSTTNFGLMNNYFGATIKKVLSSRALDITKSLVDGRHQIRISPNELNLKRNWIGEVIVGARRDIELNPQPTSAEDLYIVKDEIEIGLRLGVEYGLLVDSILTKTFAVSYPARTEEGAKVHHGFVVDLLLPKRMKDQSRLPASYVLSAENYFEFGAGVELELTNGFVLNNIGVLGKRSRVLLSRVILENKKGQEIILYKDNARISANYLHLYWRLFFKRIPVGIYESKKGLALGTGLRFTEEELIQRPDLRRALHKLFTDGDSISSYAFGDSFFVQNNFVEKFRRWTAFFWRGHTKNATSSLQINGAGLDKEFSQFSTEQEHKRFRETRQVAVQVFSKINTTSNERRLRIRVYSDDQSTSDTEMSEGYLNFINGLSPYETGDPRIIPLSPELGYSSNGYWGGTITKVEISYTHSAVARLLQLSPERFYAQLQSNSGQTENQWSENFNKWKHFRRRGLRQARHRSAIDVPLKQQVLFEAAKKFIRSLQRAQSSADQSLQVELLAKALRKAIYKKGRQAFYQPEILRSLHQILGEDAYLIDAEIHEPAFTQLRFPEGVPLRGTRGRASRTNDELLIYSPSTAVDHYFMFDSWR